jgi:transposase InsO family protein
MPWREESVMSQRKKLVEKMLLPGVKVSDVSAVYNVSRKTAYKWLNKYKKGGLTALSDASRTPQHQPNKSSDKIEAIVIETHKEFPCWGAYKLKQYLIDSGILPQAPSHPTIRKILERNRCEVIKNQKSHSAKHRFERSQPNELWQMDFKGSYMTKTSRCYPLTVIDDCSRFSIGLKACGNETRQTVMEHLSAIFKEFGLPDQINVDNGNPWGCSDLESYTSLHIWLIKLGIRLSHSSPFHPQTNGKVERFHRTLKLEVLHQQQYKDLNEMQLVFDKWQHIYNFKRPHQGIDNKTPSTRYRISTREYPNKLRRAEYPQGEIVRKVTDVSGLFRFKGKRYKAGKALSNEYIAIRETDKANIYAIYFMDSFIKKFTIQAGF